MATLPLAHIDDPVHVTDKDNQEIVNDKPPLIKVSLSKAIVSIEKKRMFF